MVKTGFRGERKGILTPSLSLGEGECGDGKGKKWRGTNDEWQGECGENVFLYTYSAFAVHIPSCRWLPQWGGMWWIIYSVSPRTPEGGQAGKGDKPPPLHILRFCGAHTQLSLAIFEGGIVANHLFGRPPNPRRGTSWKRRQTSSFTNTSFSRTSVQRGN